MNKTYTLVYVGVLAVALIALNIVVSLGARRFYVDFTDGATFRMSPEAKALVARYKEPITLRFFYSNKLANGYPAIKSYAMRIQAMLESVVAASNGNIT